MESTLLERKKVHNEIEFCIADHPAVRGKVEKAFRNSGISYCERWSNDTIFAKLFAIGKSPHCTICIHEEQKDKALELIKSMRDVKPKVKILMQKVDKVYF